MAGESADPPITDEDARELQAARDIEAKQTLETFHNFPLVLCPYADRLYFENLETIVREDKENFKRIIHAHLLSNGNQATGWDMKMLKTAVKDTMGFKENKEVDEFVSENFKIKTFREFIGKAEDIAVMTEEGLVMPLLDDSNRDLFEDAVASARNKDEKDRRKMENIKANMDIPEHVEEFYKGVNRVRAAVLAAQEKYKFRDGALARISAMDGTTDTVVGINFNLVCTEYKILYGEDLTKEAKKICGRSSLMKGLQQGKPQCLVETIAMENKMEQDLLQGEKQGCYIALKTTSKEYTETEIQAAVDACKAVRSQTDHKLNNRNNYDRNGRGGGGGGRSEPYQKPREKNVDLVRELNQQKEQRERMAEAPPPAAAAARPANPNNTDDSGHLDAIARQQPSTSNKNAMRTSPVADGDERYEGESSDDERGQIYSDDEESMQRHDEAGDKKRKKRQSLREDSHSAPPAPSHLAPLPTPAPSAHPEVPYGQLPPAPIVLRHEDDEKVTIDDLLEAAASNTLARHAAPSRNAAPRQTGNVNQQNAWEADDEETEERASPLQQVQQSAPELLQQQQPAAAAATSQGIFAPRMISPEAYPQQPQQVQPMQQMQQQPVQPMQQQAPQLMQQQPPQLMQMQQQPYDPNQQQQQQFMQQQQPQLQYAPQPGFEGQQPMAPFLPQPAPMAPMAGGMMQASFPPPQQQQPYYGPQVFNPQPPYQAQYPQQGVAYSHSQSDFGGMSIPFNPQGAPIQPQYSGGGPMSPQFQPPLQGPPQGDSSYYPHGAPPPMQPGYPPNQGYAPVANSRGPEFPPGHPNYQGPGYGAPQGQGFPPVTPHPQGLPAGYDYGPPNQARGPLPPQDYQDYDHRQQEPARHRNSPPMDPAYGGPRRREERAPPVYDDHARAPVQRRHPTPPRQERRQHDYQEPVRRRDEQGFGEGMERRGGPSNRATVQRYDSRGFGEPDREGFGERHEDRRDRGFGEMHDRHRGHQDRRRDAPLGRPQGASTPINRSRDYGGGPSLWETSGVRLVNDAKKRIRWQIICILKNLKDKNEWRLRRGDMEIEIVEVETDLYQLIGMGCGNDMDFMEATSPYLDMDKPLREFLREMQKDRLVRLYSARVRKGKTNAYEEIVYVTDPFNQPPAHLNLTPYY